MAASGLREKLHTIIFGTDTPAGKGFDLVLIYTILLSVATVMLDSVAAIHRTYGNWLYALEWAFTLLFTVEYFVRIYISPRPLRYIFSFYGLVDLLSIVPTYLSIFLTGASYLLIIRLLRVLRIFRVLKLVRYSEEANMVIRTIFQARRKIFVFLWGVIVISVVFGSLMFLVEGPERGFTSIPKSIYWVVVTITTVGYGDITPQTVFGQLISTVAMLTGYSIIAIPTGIVSAEFINESHRMREEARRTNRCVECGRPGHEPDARYCFSCGNPLAEPAPSTSGS
jgi:voltage-gated potassium channel